MTTTTATRIHVAATIAAILTLVAAIVVPGAIMQHACEGVTYDSSQDASPAYWAQWDAWRAQGYHARAGDVSETLYPAGCAS